MRLIYIALTIFPLLTSVIWAKDKGQPVRKPVPAKAKAAKERAAKKPSKGRATREKAAKEKAAKERAAKKTSEGKATREKDARKKSVKENGAKNYSEGRATG